MPPKPIKRGDKNTPEKKTIKGTINELYGYIPNDLCEFVSSKNSTDHGALKDIDEDQKKRFLAQISELKQRAAKYAEIMDQLTFNLELFPPKIQKIEKDTEEITRYLKSLLDEKEKEWTEKSKIKEELNEKSKEGHEENTNTLDGMRKKYDEMKAKLEPLNEELKKTLESKKDVAEEKEKVEAFTKLYKEDLEKKAAAHQSDMYEREKETVREMFEIREQVPLWVKKVSEENIKLENERLKKILNNYRDELRQLLKMYIGKPNQAARKAIEENEKLKESVDKNELNIKLIQSNMEVLKKKGEKEMHEMQDLTTNVKENRNLLHKVVKSQDLSPPIFQSLRNKLQKSEDLLTKAVEKYNHSKKNMKMLYELTEKLDKNNFHLRSIIMNMHWSVTSLLSGQPEHEELLMNLRVAQCLEIGSKTSNILKNYPCAPVQDGYNIYQAEPVSKPKSP